MSVYKQKISEWLIKPENFETAWEIHEAFDEAKNTLLANFYEDLKNELNSAPEMSELGYTFIAEGGIQDWYPKLGYYLINKELRVQYECFNSRPYLGIWLNENVHNLKGEDDWGFNRHGELLKQEELDVGMSYKQSEWWLAYRYVGINFIEKEAMMDILSDRRSKLIENSLNTIQQYAKTVLPLMKELELKAGSQ